MKFKGHGKLLSTSPTRPPSGWCRPVALRTPWLAGHSLILPHCTSFSRKPVVVPLKIVSLPSITGCFYSFLFVFGSQHFDYNVCARECMWMHACACTRTCVCILLGVCWDSCVWRSLFFFSFGASWQFRAWGLLLLLSLFFRYDLPSACPACLLCPGLNFSFFLLFVLQFWYFLLTASEFTNPVLWYAFSRWCAYNKINVRVFF